MVRQPEERDYEPRDRAVGDYLARVNEYVTLIKLGRWGEADDLLPELPRARVRMMKACASFNARFPPAGRV